MDEINLIGFVLGIVGAALAVWAEIKRRASERDALARNDALLTEQKQQFEKLLQLLGIEDEPVLVPRVYHDEEGLCVAVKNISLAAASGVRLYTGTGSIARVRPRSTDITLLTGEEANFYLDLPDDADDRPEALKVIWGGAELLYADAHETTLIRTRIFIEEYRYPPNESDFVMRVGVARERHERKALIKQSGRQAPSKSEDPRETWPLSALWIAANDPKEGLVLGHE